MPVCHRLLRHHPPAPLSRIPGFSGFTYVGVEETQDELKVRLLAGDERHLCGTGVRCRGISVVAGLEVHLVRRLAVAVQVRILQRLGVVCGTDKAELPTREDQWKVKRDPNLTSLHSPIDQMH